MWLERNIPYKDHYNESESRGLVGREDGSR
jgi:hypothetical protein